MFEMSAPLAFPAGEEDHFISGLFQYFHFVSEKCFGISRGFGQDNTDALFLMAHVNGGTGSVWDPVTAKERMVYGYY